MDFTPSNFGIWILSPKIWGVWILPTIELQTYKSLGINFFYVRVIFVLFYNFLKKNLLLLLMEVVIIRVIGS